jgi:hypothetical protein
MQMNWNRAAAVSIIVMLVYFVIDNHIDLYPWNNLITPQPPSTLAGVVLFASFAVGFALGIRWLMLVGAAHSYVWLGCRSASGGYHISSAARRCIVTSIGTLQADTIARYAFLPASPIIRHRTPSIWSCKSCRSSW